ncbi:EAL domain-containing protein [Enterobacter asburiae]|uniref:EAL domain-containing protein n=1 Tax=Enterobacter asburiae TaxID=61645 RepID=UPI000A266DA8|nr:EAL domain-containing protein [Enterobacter asburiae]
MDCLKQFPSNYLYPVMHYNEQKEIKGLRFQPIVKLDSRKTIGWEVLTWLRNEHPEVWFGSLSVETCLAIFLWQAREALRCEGLFWINLPVKVLSDPLSIAEICKVSHMRKLHIEVQDPENVLSLDFISYNFFSTGLQTLRSCGWKVWLDDIKTGFIDKLRGFNILVDGIKIDKSEIKNKIQLQELIAKVKTVSNLLIVEGIESFKDYHCASDLNVQLGQGFMWEETKIPMSIPHCYFSNAKLPNPKTQHGTYNIYIDCENQYLKHGIHHVLWELIRITTTHTERNTFRLVSKEQNADIVFSQKKTGETPVDCSYFLSGHAKSQHSRPVRILIADDINLNEALLCPGIDFILNYNDDISKCIRIIDQSISMIRGKLSLSERQGNYFKCRQCLLNKVTKRENEIVQLMAEGKSSDSIAQKYGCTRKVIGAHKRAFMRKVGIRSKVELYSYLYRISENPKNI